MENPLLSVVVPTKNRYEYLKYLIQLVKSINDERIELVIQDNSDDNTEIKNYLNEDNYSFVNYHYVTGFVPMATNSDKAILNSKGNYVCFIGDDDGITNRIMYWVEWMRDNGVDALMPLTVNYYWPEVKSSRGFSYGGKLLYKNITKKVTYRNCEKVLIDVISKGFINRGKLPLVYHGIVRRDTLNKIYDKCQTYFPGSSPDIANGVALSLVAEKYAYVEDAVIISGASKYHGGGTKLIGKRHPDLKDVLWFLPGAVENWDKRLPRIAEGESIWCDSALKSLAAMGREDLIERVNFEHLYKKFAMSYRDIKYMAYDLTNNKFKLFIFSNFMLFKYYILASISLVYMKMGKVKGKKCKSNIKDINAAACAFQEIN